MTRKMRVEIDREILRELIAYVYSERPAAERATLLEKACRDPVAQTDALQVMAVQRECAELERWRAIRTTQVLNKLQAEPGLPFAFVTFEPPFCDVLCVYLGVPQPSGGPIFYEIEARKSGFDPAELVKRVSARAGETAH